MSRRIFPRNHRMRRKSLHHHHYTYLTGIHRSAPDGVRVDVGTEVRRAVAGAVGGSGVDVVGEGVDGGGEVGDGRRKSGHVATYLAERIADAGHRWTHSEQSGKTDTRDVSYCSMHCTAVC